ncbi:amine oxidase [Hyaloraphidium curvatum]|nr:amine oxidase [Hyaloraphidium curvatum]
MDSFVNKKKIKEPKPGPHICVIGSGCSGLAAATALARSGYRNITVLEARDRIGGRTFTDYRWGKDVAIDQGCMFIHGSTGNPLIRDFGKKLKLVETRDGRYTRSPLHPPCDSAEPLPTAVSKLIGLRVAQLMDKAVAYAMKHPETPMSYKEWAQKAVADGWYVEGFAEGTQERAALMGMIDAVSDFEAAPLSDLSLVMFATEAAREGADAFVTSGYDGVLKQMLKRSDFDEGSILLNKPVTSIEYGDLKAPGVKITTQDGSVYMADYVVCTIPLGVMKKTHKAIFSPPLPVPASNALQAMGYGTLDKIIIRFPEVWWQVEHDLFTTFLPHSDIALMVAGQEDASDDGDGKTLCPPISDFHLLSFFSITAFHHMRPSSPEGSSSKKHKFPPVLAAWTSTSFAVGGRMHAARCRDRRTLCSQNAIEKLSDEKVKQIIMHHLRYRVFPGHPIPDPVDVIVTRWHSDPYSMGSYSYIGLDMGGRTEAEAHLREIARPVNGADGKERIFFAGEHTSLRSFSYQHAAYETGLRAAKEVANAIKKDRKGEEDDEEANSLCGCRIF